MKILRKIVHIDEELCNGCGECLPNCAEGAISIVNGKAKLKAEKLCDGLGACLGHCPMGAIQIIEREADDFDEDAVHAELAAMKKAEQQKPKAPLGCGCPGSQMMTLSPRPGAKAAPQAHGPAESALGHWPVKLRLVPPEAPFLKGAEVLITADCAPVALPDFHARLAGKVVMIACPKFDDINPHLQKLVQMFRTSGIAKVSILRMEVPCCAGLAGLVRQAVELSGADIPVEDLVVGRNGEVEQAKEGFMGRRFL